MNEKECCDNGSKKEESKPPFGRQTITSITLDKVEAIPSPRAHSLQRLTFLHMLPALIVLVSLATFLGANDASADSRAHDGKAEVALKRLGEPCFKPVDFHLFSASTTDLAGLLNGPNGVLPEPAHKLHPDLFIGPGTPHAPPYNKELKDGLERLGIPDQKRFSQAEFSLPNAIFFSFMVVAKDSEGCPTGSSPDFAEGPIIPNLLFPARPEPDSVLLSRTTFFRDGQVFDPAFIFDLKRLDKVDPAFPVDGWSHIPVFLIEAAEFGPGGEVEGNYTIHSVLLDHAGNGWDITTKFKIK